MPEKKSLLIDLHYLPSIEYFTQLMVYENVVFEVEEYFVKQTYRNRCHIRAANKVDMLSVPVIGGRKKIKVKDIEIDHSQRWQKDHWRAIKSAYGRAPYYEFFEAYFEPFFQKQEKFLADLNINLLTNCLKLLQVSIDFALTETYEKTPSDNSVIDLRGQIHPKKGYNTNDFYKAVSYPQVFGSTFAANMSIIDLLFCEGPNSRSIVTKSSRFE